MRANHKFPRAILRSAAKFKLHSRIWILVHKRPPYSNSMKERGGGGGGGGADTNFEVELWPS